MISIIVAFDKNMLIGRDNELPWHYHDDMKYFRSITDGKKVLMGLNTFRSIHLMLGKPLPNRKNVVASLEDFEYDDVEVTYNVVEYLKEPHDEEIFVIGGRSIYNIALDYADRLYITHIDEEHEGNVWFPEINWSNWKKIKETKKDILTFAVYERV